MAKLILFILLLLPLSVFSQNLSGIVIDDYSGNPLYPVTIVNLSTQQSTYSNSDGSYSIRAMAGQTIAFSYIGYEHVEYTVAPGASNTNVKIKMYSTSYQLRELIVRPKYTPYQIDSIENKRTYAPALSLPHSNPIASPVSFIAEKLSSRSKQIFRFQKNLKEWENQRFIDTRYTPQLVSSLTGLEGDSIGYFMNAYPIDYKYARAATDLELKMWIKYNYKDWLKNGKPVDSNLVDMVISKPE